MSIRKNKSGTYRADVYDINGKRIRKDFNKKSEAEVFINKIEGTKNEQKLGESKVKKQRRTFNDAFDDFKLSKADLRDKSKQKYNFVINQFRYFIDSLNYNYVDEFTSQDADDLKKELVKEKQDPKGNTVKVIKAKPKTVNFFIQTIKAFFGSEVNKGNINKNPMQHVKNLKVEKKRPDYFTAEELKKFFDQKMPDAYKNAFTGLLHTGMRIGELKNLTWNDIDLNRKLIHVRPKDEVKVKTFYSERSIPMNKTMLEMITKLNKNKSSDTYVFPSIEGKKLSDRRLLEACIKIGTEAGIKSRLYLHKFRHTFASQLVQKGVRIEVVQKLLGHANIQETMIYAHLRLEDRHDDVSKLDSLI